jgi:hypothetical protein
VRLPGPTDNGLVCAECGREPRDDQNPLDDWPSYSTGIELLTFCPDCAEREFGPGGDLPHEN